jgi:hypothetical protein
LRVLRSISSAEKTLIVLFLLTLPFVQHRVAGDGIGYYAYARSVLIDHNLQFKGDWKDPRTLPLLDIRGANGRLESHTHYTRNGHIADFYSVGPAILWAPFLLTTHAAVLALRHEGWHVAADGFSSPYLITMALATASYGFAGLWLSFRLAREYFDERWAFWATLGIWFGSALPAYMYVQPAWSHAHSAFAVALFLWYWHRTRGGRTGWQWVAFGVISGLMLDIYFANAVLLVIPLLETSGMLREAWTDQANRADMLARILQNSLAYGASTLVAFAPTLVARKIVFGSASAIGGYANQRWHWTSPAFWKVLFSLEHGLLPWTPILILALVGTFMLWRCVPEVGSYLLAAAIAFYLLISVYPWWGGVISFGNRFFISLTPIFVMGLSCTFSEFARVWSSVRGAALRVATVSVLLIVWNIGLVLQWGTGLMPSIGPVHWDEVLYNQFRVLPGVAVHSIRSQFSSRDIKSASSEQN